MSESIELNTLLELREAVFKELEQIQAEGFVIGMAVDERRIWVESKNHILNRIKELDNLIIKQRKVDKEIKERKKHANEIQ